LRPDTMGTAVVASPTGEEVAMRVDRLADVVLRAREPR
jgi:hypothetical protein